MIDATDAGLLAAAPLLKYVSGLSLCRDIAVLELWRGSEGVFTSGELIPVLEAVNERRRNTRGGASGILLRSEEEALLSLSW